MNRPTLISTGLIVILALTTSVGAQDARYVDQGDGTVKDTKTGLLWLKNANGAGKGMNWADSMKWAASLKSGVAGLSDGSKKGDWRLPTEKDLKGFVRSWKDQRGLFVNAPTDDDETARWRYWSSKKPANDFGAYQTHIGVGGLSFESRTSIRYAWAVRGGD